MPHECPDCSEPCDCESGEENGVIDCECNCTDFDDADFSDDEAQYNYED